MFPEPALRAQGLIKNAPDKNTWISNVVEPKDFKMDSNAFNTPDTDLEMAWVSGYRGSKCRNNLGYAAGGQLVYPAAGLGVVYDKSTDRQSFFQVPTLVLRVVGSRSFNFAHQINQIKSNRRSPAVHQHTI